MSFYSRVVLFLDGCKDILHSLFLLSLANALGVVSFALRLIARILRALAKITEPKEAA